MNRIFDNSLYYHMFIMYNVYIIIFLKLLSAFNQSCNINWFNVYLYSIFLRY